MLVRHRLPLLLLALAAGLASAHPRYAEYRVTIVGPAGSSPTAINSAGAVVGNISAVGINDKGQVLSNWTTTGGQQRGYIYYQGKARDIGTVPGSTSTFFVDINNAGYIAASTGGAGYLRSPNGSYRNIGALPFPDAVTLV